MPKNKKLKEIVGENVKAIMVANKLSQPKVAALAKKSGTPVDQTTVGRVARAEFPATLDTIDALANGLGIPAWQLLIESGSDRELLTILKAWVQSGEQGKRLLALAAKGAVERETTFESSNTGSGTAAPSIPLPRRGRAG